MKKIFLSALLLSILTFSASPILAEENSDCDFLQEKNHKQEFNYKKFKKT